MKATGSGFLAGLFIISALALSCQNPLEKVITTKIEGVMDTRLKSISVKLAADESYSSASLQPAFSPEVTSYTVNGDALISKADVSALLEDSGASLEYRIGGGAWTSLSSGASSGIIAVSSGTSVVELKVASENGRATRTYSVNINVAVSGAGSPAIFLPSTPSNNAQYGYHVAMSSDGTVLALSSRAYGMVAVYEKSGSSWVLAANLKDPGTGASDFYGSGLAMSRDGRVIAVGAESQANGSNTRAGKAYVFRKIGTSWSTNSEDSIVVPSAPHSDECFGSSARAGKAYVFRKIGTSWSTNSEDSIVVPSAPHSDECFGSSVAIADDGKTLVVGADHSANGGGAAYVFRGDGAGAWSQEAALSPSIRGQSDEFGYAVAISPGGNEIVVGAPGKSMLFFFAYKTGWVEGANDTIASSRLGCSLTMAPDSGALCVASGAESYTIASGNSPGAVFIYRWNYADATPTVVPGPSFTASNAVNGSCFGWSVSLSNDNKYLAVAAPSFSSSGNIVGAAYLFRNDSGTWTESTGYANPHPASSGVWGIFGSGVALSGDGSAIAIGAQNRTVGSSTSAGVAYVY